MEGKERACELKGLVKRSRGKEKRSGMEESGWRKEEGSGGRKRIGEENRV